MRFPLSLTVAALWVIAAGSRAPAAEVDFAKDIQPILAQSCLQCHGPEKARSGLHLDTREGLLKGSKSGPVVVPGKAQESTLLEVLTLPKDDSRHMPSKGDPLTQAQIDLFRDWVNQGVKWPDGLTVKGPAGTSEGTVKPSINPVNEAGLPITPAEEAAVARARQLNGLAMRLAQNTNWLRVDFSIGGRDVKDADLALLKDMPNLVELDLGGTQVTDAGLVHLEGLANLNRLQLQNTKITDAGLAHLRNLHQLHSLNLYGTAITDKGLEPLKGLKELKQLYLWQTKVTADGAKQLGQAVPGLSIDRGYDADAAVASNPPPATPGKPK